MATYIVSPQAGFPPLTQTDSTAKVPVGTRARLSDGGEAVYVQATSELSTYAAVVIADVYTAQMATTARVAETTGNGCALGFVQTSIPSAWYGWAQTSGRPLCNLAANCGPKIALFTTSTNGVLDKATVSVAYVSGGCQACTSISNATAVTLMVANNAFVTNFAQQA